MDFVYTVVYIADYMICGTFSSMWRARDWIIDDIRECYNIPKSDEKAQVELFEKYKGNYKIIRCRLNTDHQKEFNVDEEETE